MSPIFYQDTRERALDILSFIYEAWISTWRETLASLGELHLSEATASRLAFYDHEQRRAVISLLARLIVSWESHNDADFSAIVPALARELRPSFASAEAEEGIILSPAQLSIIRSYLSRISNILKPSISELQHLPTPSFDTSTDTPTTSMRPLTPESAEQLLRERLGLSSFDFLEFSDEPTFASGYFPALLQDSIDQGL